MTDDNPCPLTRREMDVIQSVSRGNRSKVVGGILGLSRHTVDSYLRQARMKTGSKTTAAMAADCIRKGWIR